ncbi:MAG: YeeE/YedE family protein [Rhodocyclales bacterium]|nr:YeeE/YedE family protein [Rhodocyclales bacterium]
MNMCELRCRAVLPGVAVGVAVIAIGVRLALDSARLTALFAIGLLLGVTLYHGSFSFAGACRRLIVHGEYRAIRAQLIMLAVASVAFAPLLAAGEFGGRALTGAFAPVGVSMVLGALLFGLGMQLAGGCGSGTLYTVGGGSPRMLFVLAAFCGGGFWASLHLSAWQSLPEWAPVVLGQRYGWGWAAALQAALLGAVAWAMRRGADPPSAARFNVWCGPWPLLLAALVLAACNVATLMLAGHPWSITWGFTLWGAKVSQALGWNPDTSAFWSQPFQRGALDGAVLADVTSLMDIGILLGAAMAAMLAGRFSPDWRIPPRSLCAALLGGLAMGYGARLSYGCNIGAFFSGVASTSLHGWLWIVAAMAGSWIGVRLRPRFGLVN